MVYIYIYIYIYAYIHGFRSLKNAVCKLGDWYLLLFKHSECDQIVGLTHCIRYVRKIMFNARRETSNIHYFTTKWVLGAINENFLHF